MKGTELASLLGLLCAASAFLNYLAAQHPNGPRLMISIYILLVILCGGSLLLDDPIARAVGTKTERVHLILAGVVGSAVIGGAWIWLNS